MALYLSYLYVPFRRADGVCCVACGDMNDANAGWLGQRYGDGVKIVPVPARLVFAVVERTFRAEFQKLAECKLAECEPQFSGLLAHLPEIIKYATYSLPFIQRACECLWALGKTDKRETGQNPNHAIRILASLAAVEQNKPFEYNKAVVDFALSLFEIPESWDHAYSPFDILSGIAQTEGHGTTSNGRSISFSPFFVRQDFVAPLRSRVVAAAISLLPQSETKIAVRAAAFLQSMLRSPMGLFGARTDKETHEQWTSEFVQTISAISNAIKSHDLDRLVLIELARTVSWHAGYGTGPASVAAQGVLALMPDDLQFRTLLAIVDPYGRILEKRKKVQASANWGEYVQKASADLRKAGYDGEPLRLILESHLHHIARSGSKESAYPLVWDLLQNSQGFARAIVENAIENPQSPTVRFAANALAALALNDPVSALAAARRLLDRDIDDLACVVGAAYGSFDFSKDDAEKSHLTVLRGLLNSNGERRVASALGGIGRVAEQDQRTAIDLLIQVDFTASKGLADDVFVLFHDSRSIPYHMLTDEDVGILLDKLRPLPQLDGHWIQEFLALASKNHAMLCANFFMRRVEDAADAQDWSIRPSNHGPYQQVPLQFRKSPEFGTIIRYISRWMQSRDDYQFRQYAADLFESMFRPFDTEVIAHFEDWLEISTAEDIRLLAKLLRETDQTFIFTQPAFVARFLKRAKQFGKKVHEQATHELYAAATTGLRSGVMGEPFPQDLEMKEVANKMLERLSRSAPEFELYELLKDHANREIERSRRQAEMLDQ